jgi:hypothetical protein
MYYYGYYKYRKNPEATQSEKKTKGEERDHQMCVGGGAVQIQGQEKELYFFLILNLSVVIIYDNNVSMLLEDAKISF